MTPLHFCIEYFMNRINEDKITVTMLINANADIHASNHENKTPLMLAQNDAELVNILST